MKKEKKEIKPGLDFERHVLAGFLVTWPEFVVNAETASVEELEQMLKDYGVNPRLLGKETKARLGFTELEWHVLAAARIVIKSHLIDTYDPPNCPDKKRGKALMLAARRLNKSFSATPTRPKKA